MRSQTQLVLSRARSQLALLRCNTSGHAPASSSAIDANLGTRTVKLMLPSLSNILSTGFSSQTPSHLSAAAPDADQPNGLQPVATDLGSADSLHQTGEQSRRFATTASPQASTSAAPAVPDWADTLDSSTSRKQRYPQPQNPPKDPWTPTQQLGKRNFLPRRMGFLLQVCIPICWFSRVHVLSARPLFSPGQGLNTAMAGPGEGTGGGSHAAEEDPRFPCRRCPRAQTGQYHRYPQVSKSLHGAALIEGEPVHVLQAVPENKGRPATFRGVCIARRNRGIRTSFTLRNHMGAVGAVERTFPLHVPLAFILDVPLSTFQGSSR